MARTFKDSKGREWQIAITVNTVKHARDRVNLDLLKIMDRGERVIERLGEDPVLLCNVLFVLVEEEAGKRGVTDVEFGESLIGDAIADATDALVRAIIDFFPQPRRGLLLKAMERAQALQTRAGVKAEEKLDEILAKMEKSLDEHGSLSGNVPESSE